MKRKADKLEELVMEEQILLPENTKENLIAQEIKFAKILAGNNPYRREKILRNFKKWLNLRSKSSFPFTDEDFLRVWKGLFYCMWMSDKPLVQEGLAEDLASLVHCFNTPEVGIQFFGSFLKTMCLEWYGIDQWRMDKFMMLVRRCTRQGMVLLRQNDWRKDILDLFLNKISTTILRDQKTTAGLIMHFVDLYVEEIAKVSEGDIPPETVSCFMTPFINFLAESYDSRLLKHVVHNIFFALLRQSDLGQEFNSKFKIWKRAGFPCDDINNLEIKEEYIDSDSEKDITENENEESNQKTALDPRAGRVNVVISELDFDAELIIKMLNDLMFKRKTMKINRSCMNKIIFKYNQYLNNTYPLGMKTIPNFSSDIYKLPNIDEKARELHDFERDLYADNINLKHLNKKQRRKWIKENVVNDDEELNTSDIINNTKIEDKMEIDKDTTESKWVEEDVQEHEPEKAYTGGNFVLSNKKLRNNSNEINEDSIMKKIKKKKLLNKSKSNDSKFQESENTATPNIKNVNKIKTKKRSTDETEMTLSKKKIKKVKNTFEVKDEWDEPLQEGETEYFVPSMKTKLKKANEENEENEETEIIITPRKRFLNPFAKSNTTTPINKIRSKNLGKLQTKSSEKRVIIALNKNSSQDTIEYHKQVLCSPLVPYDSEKKPNKSLLKPNLMPSPINPFYKKKNCLNFDGM